MADMPYMWPEHREYKQWMEIPSDVTVGSHLGQRQKQPIFCHQRTVVDFSFKNRVFVQDQVSEYRASRSDKVNVMVFINP